MGGAVILFTQYNDFKDRSLILKNSVETIGQIAKISEHKSEESSNTTYKLTVSYYDWENRLLSFSPMQTYHYADRNKIGDEVELIYEMDNPTNVMVNSFHDKYLRFIPFTIMGIAFIAASWAIVHFPNDKERKLNNEFLIL